MRDESHRFALQAQRNKKGKIKKSDLDNDKRYWKNFKKDLLKRFKNIKKIKLASIEGFNDC